MQKRKLGIILGAALGAACLAGATFAAWAVTDNADPLGIKITPKDNTSGGFNTMLLEWGDKAHFTDLSNFELGIEHAQYAYIEVKSTIGGDTTSINGGNFVATLEDRTQGKATGDAKLIDYIKVEAYTGQDPSVAGNTPTSLLSLPALPAKDTDPIILSQEKYVSTPTSGAAEKIYFKIYVSNTSISGEEMTAEAFTQMKEDTLYLSVDWNEPDATKGQHIQQTSVYIVGETAPYIYTYNKADMSENHPWPGVLMTQMNVVGPKDGEYYYTYNIPYGGTTSFDTVIFSWAGGKQTEDLNVSDSIGTPLFKITDATGEKLVGEWKAAPTFEELTYSVVGGFNKWDSKANPMTPGEGGKWTATFTISEATEIKVIASDGYTYYGGTADGHNTKGTSNTTVTYGLTEAGTYTITLDPSKTGSDCAITHVKA